jgi:hypothetical protein
MVETIEAMDRHISYIHCHHGSKPQVTKNERSFFGFKLEC